MRSQELGCLRLGTAGRVLQFNDLGIDVSKVNGLLRNWATDREFLGWRPRAQQKGCSKFSMGLGNSGPEGSRQSSMVFLHCPFSMVVTTKLNHFKAIFVFSKLRKYARHKCCLSVSDNDHLRFKLALS